MSTPHQRTRRRHRSQLASFPPEMAAAPPSRDPVRSVDVTAGRSTGVVPPSCSGLAYEADASGHRVVVREADGRVRVAFGSPGAGAGQFLLPLHAVAIAPAFAGEHGEVVSRAPWLAVADYGNRRLQFFEADGAFVGLLNLGAHEPPCRLVWRDPLLEVTTVDGRRLLVHVAAALLATGHAGRAMSSSAAFRECRRPC